MNDNVAVRVKNLSKLYQIGESLSPYHTLRETLTGMYKFAACKFGKFLKGRDDAKQGKDNQTIWALKDVSFEIKQGEIMGIIGRNGAGKSTLLKILSRITEPAEGYAEIHGRVGSLLEVGTGFHPELTGRENIYLSGVILGMKRAEIKRRFDEIVAFSEIERFIDTPVKHFSSGMSVRLGFAVAAHLELEILMVDEVLAVGDMAFQKKCIGKMGDVVRGGKTVLFVSHNMGAIRSLCDTAIWLDNGKIVRRGAADEVVSDYTETQMERFNDSSYVMERGHDNVKNLNFYISRVEMLDTKGERTNMFKYGEKLILIVELSGDAMSSNYSAEFYIYNELGQLVSVGASGAYHNIFFNKDIKRLRIEIGPLVLTSGKYTVSLSIMTGVVRADTWGHACSFTIIESMPFRSGHDISSIKEGVCILQQSFEQG